MKKLKLNQKLATEKLQNEDEEKTWFQVLAILIGGLSSFTTGMLFCWTSPSIPKIVNDKVNYDISLDEASYFTVIHPAGTIVASLLFAKLNDVIGRKYTLLSIAIPHLTSWMLIAVAKSVYVFYAARFISGLGDACLFTALPVYVGEIATPKVRGSWGNAISFSLYFGQLGINVIGSYADIRTTAYIGMSIPIIFAISFVFMPETPYFYIMKDKEEDARKSLQRLRRKENVEDELTSLKADVARQMSESGTWKDLLTIRSNRRAVYAAVFLRASQQFSGIASFSVYTQYIFIQAGGDLSADVSAIIFSALCVVLNFCAGFTLDKLGRRKSYLYSLILCGIVLFFEASYFFIQQFHTELDLTFINWFPIVGMVTYVLFYSFGLGIVPTLMLGELFSTSIKAKGLCLLNIMFGVITSSATKLFHLLETNFGLFSPFLVFSVCCFISSVLCVFFVPETKGKTLEEIQQSLKKTKSKSNQNSV